MMSPKSGRFSRRNCGLTRGEWLGVKAIEGVKKLKVWDDVSEMNYSGV